MHQPIIFLSAALPPPPQLKQEHQSCLLAHLVFESPQLPSYQALLGAHRHLIVLRTFSDPVVSNLGHFHTFLRILRLKLFLKAP